ncbi:MAG: DUF2110 family protein [Candidatus Lokiarchaeota archaeon]|nr:DUF2110 family protein [Candidatus Lokiarchaeota archaeon]
MKMVKTFVLYDKIYNISTENQKNLIIKRYFKYLNQLCQSFPNTKIKFKKLREFDKRIEVEIIGPEEVFIFNLLKKEIGTINNFEDINPNKIVKGTLIDVGKVGFGIFVDCAILNPQTDVLINLHSLREQLCSNKEKSLKEIIKIYDFIDNFPIWVKIVSIDKEKQQVQGILDDLTLDFYKKLIKEGLEAVFLTGETKGQFKKALIRRGHLRDIVSIERYGFLENVVILKEGTNAPGIIANIGKYLKNCKMSAIRPEKFKNFFNFEGVDSGPAEV